MIQENKVTLFKHFNRPIETLDIKQLFQNIKAGKYAFVLQQYRDLLKRGLLDKAEKAKKSLPAFTPSASFRGGRKGENIHEYAQIIHLDFDKIPDKEMEKAIEHITMIPFTFACFRSPSLNGLKIFVKVDTDQYQHKEVYKAIQLYYEEKLNLHADPSCKDITRLCFVSEDSRTYINPNPAIFQFQIAPVQQHRLFQDCLSFTEKILTYESGSRNAFLFQLACNCNRKGIPFASALDSILQQLPHEAPSEVEATVRSAYRNQPQNPPSPTVNEAEPLPVQEEDGLKTTPLIPDWIFEELPLILKQAIEPFRDKRKRDVMLTGVLTTLSGCLPKVTGRYHGESLRPNIFSFIIAPPASGKGVLKNARRMGAKIHDDLMERSKAHRAEYYLKLKDYEKQLQQKTPKTAPLEEPIKPPFKTLFIPADCSHARMIEMLFENDGNGIIIETEADTMGATNKQDWGDYSQIMRKAFHHEPISLARKSIEGTVEIPRPAISVALTGTPSQVRGLIASAEDGLFSRFLFYLYRSDIRWQDPSPKSQPINFGNHFHIISENVFKLWTSLQDGETEVTLSETQWESLNHHFSTTLQSVTIFSDEEASSVVYRLAVIAFRMCMILTCLRKFELKPKPPKIRCSDKDFKIVLAMADTYLQHSLFLYGNLAKNQKVVLVKMPISKQELYNALPHEFSRKQAVELGPAHRLSSRSVDDFLSKNVGKLFDKISLGNYRKK